MRTIQTLKDALTMSRGCLLLSKRNPDTILTSIIAPIFTALLFAHVIGGTMQVGETSYMGLIVPGIILWCLGQCVATTAIAACPDIKNGIVECLCTTPARRSSTLNGYAREAFIRNMITALLILLVTFLINSRPEADLLGWCAALLIISLYVLTLSQIPVYFEMIVNSPEGMGSFSILAITLPCISSGFVPIDAMPKALQIFAEYQPITLAIDSLHIPPLNESLKIYTLLSAILQCMALLLLFYILSVRAFKKKNNH